MLGTTPTIRVLAVTTLAALVACSLAVDASRRQCGNNRDCTGHGLRSDAVCVANVCVEPALDVNALDAGAEDAAPVDPMWGCIGNVPDAVAPDPATPVHFFARYVGLLSSSPLSGITVKPCPEEEKDCASFQGTPLTTDANGQVDVPLYNGFRGYLELGPSPTGPNIMPTLSYIQPVPNKENLPETPKPFTWVLLTKSDFEFLTGNFGKTLDPTLGHIIFGSRDCQQIRPVNTTVRAEPIAAQTFSYYTDSSGLPSLTQGKTSASGNGGFCNLPPGYVTMKFSREAGEPIGTYSVLVRAGTITQLVFGPTVHIKAEP